MLMIPTSQVSVLVAYFAVALASAPAQAGPRPALPLGAPITDPNTQPQVIGVGHTDPLPSLDSPTILFLNFDGANLNSGCGNDPRNDCSLLAGLFGGEILPFSGSDADRAAIVQSVREDVADFGVVVLGERPPEGQPYAMVLVGDSAAGGTSELGFGGIAPTIDCGNSNPYITSFALEVGGINSEATVINQEAAHTWGLEHVNDPSDNLHPSAGGFSDPKYNDTCNKIVANTDLDPANGQCNSIHTMFCDAGFQNSYQEMLALFGAPIPDDVAPTVTIDSPAEGETWGCPVDAPLTITLDDDRRPQNFETTIFLDDAPVISGLYINTTLSFPVQGGIAPGSHSWRVEITDESGNPASAEVQFQVATNPDDPMCASVPPGGTDGSTGGTTSQGTDTVGEGAQPFGDPGGCACRSGAPRPVTWWALGLVLPLLRRRRGAAWA